MKQQRIIMLIQYDSMVDWEWVDILENESANTYVIWRLIVLY